MTYIHLNIQTNCCCCMRDILEWDACLDTYNIHLFQNSKDYTHSVGTPQ